MSTHVYREPFPCDTACERLDPPCPGGHAVVVTYLITSGITSIHVEPGKPGNRLWLDIGGVDALYRTLIRAVGCTKNATPATDVQPAKPATRRRHLTHAMRR